MSDEKVVLIETNKILVINPRQRDKFIHKEIKENIRQNWPEKRPVTVRRIVHNEYEFALICGQGRLEAYIHYQEAYIPRDRKRRQ